MRKIFRSTLALLALALSSITSQAQSETLSSGAFIINMGATNPQTIANGIKPYGLMYDLLRNYSVPIKWVISQSKLKDGADFTYNGVQYKGGTFIIPAEYRTTAVNSRITYWAGQGVVGTTTNSALTVDVTYTIKSYPRWTLDVQNGAIAETYLISAGISNAAFPAAYNWKSPQTLGSCDDFFVMPHAEPTWATHSNLLAWNRDYFGSIWAACHAVSAIENMVNPANTSDQTNFLTTKDATATTPLVTATYANSNSLLLWTAHSAPSAPFTTRLPSDPIAQFMGLPDAALVKGSETVFIPRQAGAVARWNAGVKVITYDPSQTDVTSPNGDLRNTPALIAYGRAFDDPARGYVMYEAGHSHNKGTAGDVAAMRAFFNFSFFQTTPKAPQINGTGPAANLQVSNGEVLSFSVSATSPLPGNSFTYQWTANADGTFSAPTATSTTFTPNATAGPCVVTCTVTDNCGRTAFQSFPVTILPSPTAPTVVNDAVSISGTCPPGTPVTLNVMDNDIPNTSTISFTSLNQGTASPANAGVWVSNGSGSITFTPDANFNGAATITYTVTNTQNLTSNGTISVSVGGTDANGCNINSVYGPADVNFINLASIVSQSGVSSATTSSTALDDNEATYSSEGTDYLNMGITGTNNIILPIGSGAALRYKDSINVYWKGSSSSTTYVTIQLGAVNGTWTTSTVFSAASSSAQISKFAIPSGISGLLYIKISSGNNGTANSSGRNVYLDAVEYEYLSCISKDPTTANDNAVILEDQPTVINVLSNDTDPQGLALTLKEISVPPTIGKASINPDGTITYISNTDVSGTDSLSYSAVNTEGYIDTAKVYITINDDGCVAGSYKASNGSGVVTKIFQYGLTGTNAATANATTTNFKDSYLKGSSSSNYGGTGQTTFYAGVRSSTVRRPIYYFNISEIPTGAIVQSASFSTTTSAASSPSSTTKMIAVHALTRTWNETECNWTYAVTNPSNVSWTTGGGDFNATPADSVSVGSASGLVASWNLTSLVQSWVTTPANNYGVIQKTNETLSSYHSFASRDNSTQAYRPKLTVTYVVTVACAAIPNRAPLANPVYATTLSGQAITIPALTGCYDVDAGNTVTLFGVYGNGGGTTATTSGSNIIYTPSTSGTLPRTDRISYIISDGTLKDTAYAYITVNNAAPSIVKDLASTNSGTLVNITVKTNDTDPEGASLGTPVITASPKYGTATVNGNAIDYTPGTGYTGNDTLVYQLSEAAAATCASSPLSDTALVVITVNNQTPVANADSKTGLPCQELKIDLTANDTDAENGVLTAGNISALSNPAAGTLINNNDGTVTFYPATGYTGSFTFTYKITDDGVSPKTSGNATVTVTIAAAANSTPVAVDDVADPSPLNQTVYYMVTDNDTDPDGNTLTNPVITVDPLHGTASVLANGLIKYIPNTGFHGTDTLTYQVCDFVLNPGTCVGASTLCATAKLSFTVNSAGITISGDLWHDKNGDIALGAGETSTNAGYSLYVNLIDGSGNVVQTALANADGTYSFTEVDPGNTYSIVLSTTQGTIGQPAPAALPPAGWGFTGTSLLGTTFSNTGVIGPLAFGYSNSSEFDFGIEQLPNTDPVSANVSQPLIGQSITLNGVGANPPALSGSDPEDCSGGCSLSTRTVVIDAIPVKGELYYNGVLVTNGQVISGFNASLFTYKFTANATGSTTTFFTYSFKDAAGLKDPTPATYTLSWMFPLPVTGLTLTASQNGNTASLKWLTRTEFRSSYFELQRSTDNAHYSAVANVTAAGNSNTEKNYSYADDISSLTSNTALYYRIRQVDIDNRSVYSNVAPLKLKQTNGLSVWPNPFTDHILIAVTTDDPGVYTIKLMNSAGQMVRSEKQSVGRGTSQLSMTDLSSLAPGIYLVRAEDKYGAVVMNEKLLKR